MAGDDPAFRVQHGMGAIGGDQPFGEIGGEISLEEKRHMVIHHERRIGRHCINGQRAFQRHQRTRGEISRQLAPMRECFGIGQATFTLRPPCPETGPVGMGFEI